MNLSQRIKLAARDLGFDFCRIIPVRTAARADALASWLDDGRSAEMHYLQRNVEKRIEPRLLDASLPLRSMVVLGVDYHQFAVAPELLADPSRGIIASYAWGADYHELIRPLLHELDGVVRTSSGRTALGKCLVDSGPVLERDWAERAGIGFTGKNCCTIHPGRGSWIFLATLLVPESLDVDEEVAATPLDPAAVIRGLPPREQYGAWRVPAGVASPGPAARIGTCGRCDRCLTACPTDAFTGPFSLDPRRCIAYWTIETDTTVPHSLRARFGNRIFGCDICQEVCPWNLRLADRAPSLAGLQALGDRVAPPLLEGFAPEHPYWLDDDAFAARFRRSPIRRAKRHGMLRNVCLSLGNWGDPRALPALAIALRDAHDSVRAHAAWAIGALIRRDAQLVRGEEILRAQLTAERDPAVTEELQQALQRA